MIYVVKANDVGIGIGSDEYENKIVKRSLSKNLNRATGYPIPNARQTFTQLKRTFTKALMLQHFDLKYYIKIKTEVLDYAISRVLNLLFLNNLS